MSSSGRGFWVSITDPFETIFLIRNEPYRGHISSLPLSFNLGELLNPSSTNYIYKTAINKLYIQWTTIIFIASINNYSSLGKLLLTYNETPRSL
jgi:hypothetical protein